MPLRPAAALAATILALVLAAPASAALHLTSLGTFNVPVYVAAPPGDPHRLMVVEQGGKIIELHDGVKQATPFLDLSREIKVGGEQGLLSMAFAPDYATSGRFYVYYTAPKPGDSGGNVLTVEEFGSPAGRRIVFTVPHPTNSNHNGGQLQFGPDGLLYAGTGDGGGANDQPNNAQNPSSLLGKMLRIDPRVVGAAPEIYALGLRNPFRFSFDRQTGDMVIGDVGQDNWEEVDFSPAGTPAGRNYGWHCREGFHANPAVTCSVPGAVDPVLEKAHSSTDFRAIIGGYVVRDPTLPELNGRYVYGDNNAAAIRSVTLPGASDDSATGLTVSGLTSFGEDSCGHIYTTQGGGQVSRIDGDAFTPCPEPAAPGSGSPAPGGSGPAPGGGAPGSPAPAGGGGTVLDKRAPVVRIRSVRRRPAMRVHDLRLSITCDELCGATLKGRLRVHAMKRPFALRRAVKQIAAGKRVKVDVKLPRRVQRALRRHHRGSAHFVVTARDAAGNPANATRTIRLLP